ncbi:MAG: type II toxin-antitoxin system RelE/ParE family toxin [Bacteroidota bacterium]
MVVEFKNTYLQNLFEGKPVTGKPKYSGDVIMKFKKTVLMLQFAESVSELRKFKGLNFEALKGDMKGYYSVRVNIQYRLILSTQREKVVVSNIIFVEDLSKHYE